MRTICTLRTIVAAQRNARSTIIKLDCGHERSIGGHQWFGGKEMMPAKDLVRFRIAYRCHDGRCGELGA